MINRLRFDPDQFRRRFAWPVIGGFWLLGLILGLCYGIRQERLAMLISQAVTVRPGWPELLFSTVFPFLISGLVVRSSEPWLLPLFIFAKAFCFGFCACGTIHAFAVGSWLVRFFFLFGSWMTGGPLLLYCGRRFAGIPERSMELGCFLAFSFAVFLMDYFIISPFLVSLFG